MAPHLAASAAGAVAAALTVFAADHRATPDAGPIITAHMPDYSPRPRIWVFADSGTVYVTAELFRGATPAVLALEARQHDLSVRWRAG